MAYTDQGETPSTAGPLPWLRLLRPALPALLLFIFLSLPEVRAQIPVAPPPSPAAKAESVPAASEGPEAIPVNEVPERLQSTAMIVRAAAERAAPLANITTIEEAMPSFAAGVKTMAANSRSVLDRKEFGKALAPLQSAWNVAERRLEGWQTILKARSQALQNDLMAMRDASKVWELTEQAQAQQELPAELLKEISKTRASIREAEQAVLKRRNQILQLQGKVSELGIEIDRIQEDLNKAANTGRGNMFQVDAPPIWKSTDGTTRHADWLESDSQAGASQTEFVRYYFETLLTSILSLAGTFILLLVLLLVLRRKVAKSGPLQGAALRRFDAAIRYPVSTALLFTGIWALTGLVQTTELVGSLGWILLIVPLLRLMPSIFSQGLKGAVWVLAGVAAAHMALLIRAGETVLDRAGWVGISAALAAGLFWLARWLRSRFAASHRLQAMRITFWITIALLVLAILGEISGLTGLSRHLTTSLLKSSYAAAMVYGAVRILREMSVWTLRSSESDVSRAQVESKVGAGLEGVGVVVFGIIVMNAFQVTKPVVAAARDLLGRTVTLGAIEVSAGSVFTFTAVMIGAVLLSRLLRFFLSASLYHRLAFQRGLGESISKLTHYAVLTLGLLLALSAVGIDLNKFTVLAGAFGLGIGIGMQNIIGNFVAGLILLFERPMHVGDVVTIGASSGRVKDIGIRASTVSTWDGADVVIPNANLISNEFINWTLSDSHRRGQLQIGVAYGTDPERVIRILKEVAVEHPHVLPNPAPIALFSGFGESSLDFVLYYWTDLDNFQSLGSDIHTAVCRRMREEEIEIPFPQRDLNLKSELPALRSASSGAAAGNT